MNKVTSHCRLCAECKPYTKMVDLSYDVNKRNEITTKLIRLDNSISDVFTNNDLPKTVCLVCIHNLNSSYNFIINFETAQKVLNKIYTEQIESNSESIIKESHCEPTKEIYLIDKNVKAIKDDRVKKKMKARNDPSKEIYLVYKNVKPVKDDTVKNKIMPSVVTSTRMTWKEYSWTCWQCDTIFPTLDELQTHTIEIHGICNRYKCTECNSYRNRQNLDTLILHVGKKHRNDLKYSCYKCHLQFNTPQMCSKHKLEHKNQGLSCPGCNYAFDNIEDLNEHKAKYYKGVSYRLGVPNIPITDNLTCQICNVTCKTKYLLLRHMSKSHSDQKKDFLCDNCGKCFVTKGDLSQHSLVHTDVCLYKCDKCTFSCKSSMLLKSHSIIHNEVKPYSCTDCEKSFRKRSHLNIHRALHTEVRRYKCVHCDKEFRWRMSLVQHIRQHTGERPYQCEQCLKSFTNWPNYRKHTKGVHGINELPKKNKS